MASRMGYKMSTKFILTKDHIKLIKSFNIDWSDCETGAPAIDPKRPFGNSYVAGDVKEILNREMDDDEALGIYFGTKEALQIMIDIAKMKTGEYRLVGGRWRKS